MLYPPNATVTIGKLADIPQAPSLNTPSATAITPFFSDKPVWTERAEVRDVNARDIMAFHLTPDLNEKDGRQTYSIFFQKGIVLPAWIKPKEDVYVKFDNGGSISGLLRVRLGLSSFGKKHNLSTPYFVVERGSH